jgi:hypothetical protein
MDKDKNMIDSWQKLCDSINAAGGLKVELTPEESDQISRMLEIQKRANDPKYWKNIILGSPTCAPNSQIEGLIMEYRNCAISAALAITQGDMVEFTKMSDKELKAKAALLQAKGGK